VVIYSTLVAYRCGSIISILEVAMGLAQDKIERGIWKEGGSSWSRPVLLKKFPSGNELHIEHWDSREVVEVAKLYTPPRGARARWIARKGELSIQGTWVPGVSCPTDP